MNFITVADAKVSGLIPEPYHAVFYDKCHVCGEDMVISDSRTILKCSNPRCYLRTAAQMAGMLADLGYKGWGDIKCLDYIRYKEFKSILNVLLEPPGEFRDIVQDIKDREFTYPQLIKLLHIPRLNTRLESLLKGIDNYDQLVSSAAEMGSLFHFCQSRIGGSDLPADIAEVMNVYSTEFQYIEGIVPPVIQAKQAIRIAITGNIQRTTASDGSKLTKAQYVQALNRIGREAGIEYIMSGAIQSVQFIVADYESSSDKYRTGQRRGCLITSDKLLAATQMYATPKDSTEEPECSKTNNFGGDKDDLRQHNT